MIQANVWMGDVTKVACGMDKKQVYIQRIIHTRL